MWNPKTAIFIATKDGTGKFHQKRVDQLVAPPRRCMANWMGRIKPAVTVGLSRGFSPLLSRSVTLKKIA